MSPSSIRKVSPAKAALLFLLSFGCASSGVIPNTRVSDTPINRELVAVCERYRQAMERHDADTLIALASPRYFEDSGTPKADDDYNYEGLKRVIRSRMAALRSVRYEMEYRNVEIKGDRAVVEVYIDASFQLAGGTDANNQYKHVTEYNRLELEHDGKRWLFTGGM